jgi:RimJ/RimL family protein N-acetyltransferase
VTVDVTTPRLRLAPFTLDIADKQLDDPPAFFAALGVEPCAGWPPPLNDRETMAWTRDKLAEAPETAGWHAWAFIDPGPGHGLGRLIGIGGFTGPPDDAGEVEVGYAILPREEGKGYATEATRGLTLWAFGDPRVARVVALTLAGANGVASRRVLEKAGYSGPEPASEEGVLRFWRDRAA